jgi:hypothetical protein
VSDFSMQSDGALFTLLSAHSDQPDGCGFAYPSCGGERGLLQQPATPGRWRMRRPGGAGAGRAGHPGDRRAGRLVRTAPPQRFAQGASKR